MLVDEEISYGRVLFCWQVQAGKGMLRVLVQAGL